MYRIVLQDVDNLKVSDFLIVIFCKHIERKISIKEANMIIDEYYDKKKDTK